MPQKIVTFEINTCGDCPYAIMEKYLYIGHRWQCSKTLDWVDEDTLHSACPLPDVEVKINGKK
jgi:hypothetical protein